MLEELLKTLWAVEYSKEQNAFHVQTLSDAVQGNLQEHLSNHPGTTNYTSDYQILSITATREEADAFVTAARDVMAGRRVTH